MDWGYFVCIAFVVGLVALTLYEIAHDTDDDFH